MSADRDTLITAIAADILHTQGAVRGGLIHRHDVAAMLDACDRLGYRVVGPAERRIERSLWVVNEETDGILYSVDYHERDALQSARYWQSRGGPRCRIDLVEHEYYTSTLAETKREMVVPAERSGAGVAGSTNQEPGA